jgi:la-related protein 1
MDSEGYLPIKLIASFHRVYRLSTNIEVVCDAIKNSDVLEVNDYKVCLRSYSYFGIPVTSLLLIVPRSVRWTVKKFAHSMLHLR